MFKRIFLLVLFCACLLYANSSFAKAENVKSSTVYDSKTQKPIKGAKIYIPDTNFETTTDSNGRFELNAQIDDKSILQVEKEGYRPYSLTIDKNDTGKNLNLGIDKTSLNDAYIDTGIFHLGDDMYSNNSANCGEFRARPIGPYYSRKVNLNKPKGGMQAVIVFGSVIGLDTKTARELGQNRIASVYSSPAEVIFNGKKIGELNINGDNQKIVIPSSLIAANNEIVIKTGKNLFQYKYTDYDDMEFANLRIEYQENVFANRAE